eukprot:TRINITY_DN27164_c0_g1_i1.p2 TRINITY_DN27164_c0_g1~~TRINITY_DN27164_c0_g1_i1.p2  ORF type:complete len:290 (+),score=105.17 TRINITY_DN27164_c0_g1_i1:120-872(+)
MHRAREKNSSWLRKRKQAAMETEHGRSCAAACASFCRDPDPFSGIQQVPLFNKYLYHLRPWDSKPSPQYVDLIERRHYWYNHPPSLMWMLCVLAGFAVSNLLVALFNLAVNQTLFWQLWRDLKRPDFVYENIYVLLYCWFVAHLLNAFAAWFVYLSGGMWVHLHRMVPYVGLLFFEALLPDIMFAWRRIDVATFWEAGCVVLCMLSMWSFYGVTKLSPVCMVPLLAGHMYLLILFAHMYHLNGPAYERVV